MDTNSTLVYRPHRNPDRISTPSATPAVVNNKLEALKILANSILAELSSLEQAAGLDPETNVDLAGEVQRYEADLIRSALIRTGGRQRRAAALLTIKPTTLHEKMKRYGMNTRASEPDFEVG